MGIIKDILDIADALGLDEEEVINFKEDSPVDFTWEELKKVMELALSVRYDLGSNFDYCELNDCYDYDNGDYDYADEIGIRIYVINANDLDVHMIVQADSIEVSETGNADETAESFSKSEKIKACEYAINMGDDGHKWVLMDDGGRCFDGNDDLVDLQYAELYDSKEEAEDNAEQAITYFVDEYFNGDWEEAGWDPDDADSILSAVEVIVDKDGNIEVL